MAEKDNTEKILESYNEVFADIVNVLLFDGEEVVKATPHNSRHASCLHNVPSYCPKILRNTQSIPSNFQTI